MNQGQTKNGSANNAEKTEIASSKTSGSDEFHSSANKRNNESAEQISIDAENLIRTIESDFPHIAEKIRQLWWDKTNLDGYLSNIVLMDRSGRKGFPAPIMSAILGVWNKHQGGYGKFVGPSRVRDIWSENPTESKGIKKLDSKTSYLDENKITGIKATRTDVSTNDKAQVIGTSVAWKKRRNREFI